MKQKEWFFGTILVFSIFLMCFIVYAYQLFYTPNLQVGTKSDVYFYIEEGEGFKSVLQRLKDEKIVHETVSFAFVSKLRGYQENVKAGRYLIRKGSSNSEAVTMFRAGIQAPVKVVFNNIRTLNDLTERLGEQLACGKPALDKYLRSSEMQKQYKLDTMNIISLFMPDTYEFYWNTSPQKVAEKMHKVYQTFWNQKRVKQAKDLNLSQQEVITLASIVQAETAKNDEKPRVAGVYLNRLRIKMKLQADPTLVFGLRDFTLKRLLDVHKNVNSPYNTYKYEGLPPGPINMPIAQSIDAVLNFEAHKYLYFCAKDDFSGYHNFATNYNEHLRNARLYQKALDLKGIK